MSVKINEFNKKQEKKDVPEITSGDTVRVTQKVGDRKQSFEGLVIAKKHGKGVNSTITVRKVIDKVGVEKIFPLHTKAVENIEVIRKGKTRRAKIYYIRDKAKKIARKKIKQEKE